MTLTNWLTVAAIAGTFLALILAFVVFRLGAEIQRLRLEIEIKEVHATERITALTTQANYWRTRAEKLTDAALVRTGAIHEPTMQDRDPSENKPSIDKVIANMGLMEIGG